MKSIRRVFSKNLILNVLVQLFQIKINCSKKSDEGFGTMYDTKFKGEAFESNTLDNLLDKLNIKSVFFLKVDVEGHEPKLLKGAKNIGKYKPFIYRNMVK